MALNVQGLKPETENALDRGRWLIHGEQGSGKTTLASTIAKCGKTAFLDFVGEKGTRSFAGAPYAKNIDVYRLETIAQLDDVYYQLAADDGAGYDAVIVDSLTALQSMAMNFIMNRNETAMREITRGIAKTPEFKDWGQRADILNDVGTHWYALADGSRPHPLHVVMTAQTESKENEVTGETNRSPVIQRGALPTVLASADYILYTEVEENPDFFADDSLPPSRHVVRFGPHPGYRTKARLPYDMRGKLPSIIGREKPADLTTLSRALKIGGVPAVKKTATPAETPSK